MQDFRFNFAKLKWKLKFRRLTGSQSRIHLLDYLTKNKIKMQGDSKMCKLANFGIPGGIWASGRARGFSKNEKQQNLFPEIVKCS